MRVSRSSRQKVVHNAEVEMYKYLFCFLYFLSYPVSSIYRFFLIEITLYCFLFWHHWESIGYFYLCHLLSNICIKLFAQRMLFRNVFTFLRNILLVDNYQTKYFIHFYLCIMFHFLLLVLQSFINLYLTNKNFLLNFFSIT